MSRFIPILIAAACATETGKATLEVDGAWVRAFETDRDTAFHTAMRVLIDEGYTVSRADPIGGTLVATSPVRSSGLYVSYTIARVIVEPVVQGAGMRVRLTLTRTREQPGGGREPNNDRAVRDRDAYEAIFDKMEQALT